MNVIKYNVNSGDVCQIGRQYEYGKSQVVFEGYQITDSANEIYFKFVGRTEDSKYLIPIIDMTLDITQQLTKHVGQFSCQLEEMNTEGTLVSQSPVFYVAVKRSIKVGADYEVQDPRLETIYQKYNEMYNIISQTNETSLANESQRQAEWLTLKQEVSDAINSFDADIAIGEFRTLVQTETDNFNTNATEKLNAYNSNADNRLSEFNTHTEQIQTDISELKSDLGELKSDLASLQTESYFFLKENFDIGSWISYTLRVDESQVKYRIANKDGTFISFDNDTTIVARDGFRFFYKSEAEESNWSTVAKITKNTNIVLTIARVTENTSETATVEEFISGVYLKSESKVKQEEQLQKNIFLNTFVKPNEVGTVSNYLIFSRTHHYPNKLCRIICENGYKVAYHKFSDPNLTDKLQDSGWLDNDYQFIMDNNYYQFLMRKDDYSTIGLEDESRAVAYIDDVFVNVNEFRKKDRYYPSFLVPSKSNIVMHRGANQIAPENTIPAFEEGGKNKNVFGLECDVRCTSDKKYIIMHDETVDRTTNGSGSVYDMTFEQIRALNIDEGANIQDYPDLKVPTLEEYLLTCKKYGKVAVIELEYNSKNPKTYISDIINIIKKCGMERSSILTSFEDYADSIRSCTRMIPFLLLLGSSATVSFDVYKGLCGGDNMGLNVDKQNLNLTKEVIQEIHYDDGIIAVYCPNITTEFDIYADLGIDLITTDYLPQE